MTLAVRIRHTMAWISVSTVLLVVLAVSAETHAFSCCRKYTKTRISTAIIRGFSIQTIYKNCYIPAVIFHTHSGRNICTDPAKPWVMKNIRKLRKEAQMIKKKIIQKHSKNK